MDLFLWDMSWGCCLFSLFCGYNTDSTCGQRRKYTAQFLCLFDESSNASSSLVWWIPELELNWVGTSSPTSVKQFKLKPTAIAYQKVGKSVDDESFVLANTYPIRLLLVLIWKSLSNVHAHALKWSLRLDLEDWWWRQIVYWEPAN